MKEIIPVKQRAEEFRIEKLVESLTNITSSQELYFGTVNNYVTSYILPSIEVVEKSTQFLLTKVNKALNKRENSKGPLKNFLIFIKYILLSSEERLTEYTKTQLSEKDLDGTNFYGPKFDKFLKEFDKFKEEYSSQLSDINFEEYLKTLKNVIKEKKYDDKNEQYKELYYKLITTYSNYKKILISLKEEYLSLGKEALALQKEVTKLNEEEKKGKDISEKKNELAKKINVLLKKSDSEAKDIDLTGFPMSFKTALDLFSNSYEEEQKHKKDGLYRFFQVIDYIFKPFKYVYNLGKNIFGIANSSLISLITSVTFTVIGLAAIVLSGGGALPIIAGAILLITPLYQFSQSSLFSTYMGKKVAYLKEEHDLLQGFNKQLLGLKENQHLIKALGLLGKDKEIKLKEKGQEELKTIPKEKANIGWSIFKAMIMVIVPISLLTFGALVALGAAPVTFITTAIILTIAAICASVSFIEADNATSSMKNQNNAVRISLNRELENTLPDKTHDLRKRTENVIVQRLTIDAIKKLINQGYNINQDNAQKIYEAISSSIRTNIKLTNENRYKGLFYNLWESGIKGPFQILWEISIKPIVNFVRENIFKMPALAVASGKTVSYGDFAIKEINPSITVQNEQSVGLYEFDIEIQNKTNSKNQPAICTFKIANEIKKEGQDQDIKDKASTTKTINLTKKYEKTRDQVIEAFGHDKGYKILKSLEELVLTNCQDREQIMATLIPINMKIAQKNNSRNQAR